MKTLFFITFCCSFFCSHSQKNYSDKLVLSQKREYLNDTNLVVSDYLPLETRGFYLIFSKIRYNPRSSILHLVGQTKVNDKTKTGFPGVVIFTGFRKSNQLRDTTNLTFSSSMLNDDFTSSGCFNISFKVKKNMRLYFHRSYFLLKEYRLDRFIKCKAN